jgi:hypothetical protein
MHGGAMITNDFNYIYIYTEWMNAVRTYGMRNKIWVPGWTHWSNVNIVQYNAVC